MLDPLSMLQLEASGGSSPDYIASSSTEERSDARGKEENEGQEEADRARKRTEQPKSHQEETINRKKESTEVKLMSQINAVNLFDDDSEEGVDSGFGETLLGGTLASDRHGRSDSSGSRPSKVQQRGDFFGSSDDEDNENVWDEHASMKSRGKGTAERTRKDKKHEGGDLIESSKGKIVQGSSERGRAEEPVKGRRNTGLGLGGDFSSFQSLMRVGSGRIGARTESKQQGTLLLGETGDSSQKKEQRDMKFDEEEDVEKETGGLFSEEVIDGEDAVELLAERIRSDKNGEPMLQVASSGSSSSSSSGKSRSHAKNPSSKKKTIRTSLFGKTYNDDDERNLDDLFVASVMKRTINDAGGLIENRPISFDSNRRALSSNVDEEERGKRVIEEGESEEDGQEDLTLISEATLAELERATSREGKKSGVEEFIVGNEAKAKVEKDGGVMKLHEESSPGDVSSRKIEAETKATVQAKAEVNLCIDSDLFDMVKVSSRSDAKMIGNDFNFAAYIDEEGGGEGEGGGLFD